jgi:hypothetical protein
MLPGADDSPLDGASQPRRQTKTLEPALTKTLGQHDQVLGGTRGACRTIAAMVVPAAKQHVR